MHAPACWGWLVTFKDQIATSSGTGQEHGPRNGSDRPLKRSDGVLRFVDLFCGCGGFSLGLMRAGLKCVAAIDFDETAVRTFRENLPDVRNVLCEDLTRYGPERLAAQIGTSVVDLIVGGPPCQGFSTARQVDGANHGDRLKDDPRRGLYREFLKYVDHFQPRVFVIENVIGMRNAAGGEFFTRVHHEARVLGHAAGKPGYRVHAQIEDARALGVPQKRRRQLIIGVRADIHRHFVPELLPVARADADCTLNDAIGDLPILRAGGGLHERDYDLDRRQSHLRSQRRTAQKYLYEVLEVERAEKLTNHIARPHSDRDLRDFARLREGENSLAAMRDRGVKFEFPYDKSCFKDRYTRQSRAAPCSTIVAHLSKDGLMFIHPTQTRSLTPREAARIQSFPDWFVFPHSRTTSFKLIGNAVPPLVAESIGEAVIRFLRELTKANGASLTTAERQRVAKRVVVFATMSRAQLRAVEKHTFAAGWSEFLSLFPELHPDNALDHGVDRINCIDLANLFPTLSGPSRQRYKRSGWPLAFSLFGNEAWRRKRADQLTNTEFYNAIRTAAPRGTNGRTQRHKQRV